MKLYFLILNGYQLKMARAIEKKSHNDSIERALRSKRRTRRCVHYILLVIIISYCISMLLYSVYQLSAQANGLQRHTEYDKKSVEYL